MQSRPFAQFVQQLGELVVSMSPLVSYSMWWSCWWACWWLIAALTFGLHCPKVGKPGFKKAIFSGSKPLIKGLPVQVLRWCHVHIEALLQAIHAGLLVGGALGHAASPLVLVGSTTSNVTSKFAGSLCAGGFARTSC